MLILVYNHATKIEMYIFLYWHQLFYNTNDVHIEICFAYEPFIIMETGHSHGRTASVSFQLLCIVNENTFCSLTCEHCIVPAAD